jgi:hypothetical protein
MQKAVNANADASFVISLKNEVITRVMFFARAPKFEFDMKPIIKPISGTSPLIIETYLDVSLSYAYDGDLEVTVKEKGGIPNEFAFFVVTGPVDVRIKPSKGW